MKRLVKNLALFAVILLVIRAPFTFFYRDEPEKKRVDLAKGQYNTVFVGSSRTRDGIIPSYFDSQTNGKTRSYNFGLPAGLPPDTLDWCEEIVRNQSGLKYMFFELAGLMENLPVDKLPPRYFSASTYFRTVSSLPNDKLSFYHDGMALALFKPDLPRDGDGDFGHRTDAEKKAFVEKLSFSFELNRMMERTSGEQPWPANEGYLRRINELIAQAESRQVRIYFFIPPRIETANEFRTLYPIYQRLDPAYKLYSGHDDESLYRPEMSLDEFHLSPDAAANFTKQFAESFNKREQ